VGVLRQRGQSPRVHAYGRAVGHLRAEQDPERYDEWRRAYAGGEATGYHKTVDRWSGFESWVLARMPSEPCAKFLRECRERTPLLRFEAQPVGLHDTSRCAPDITIFCSRFYSKTSGLYSKIFAVKKNFEKRKKV